MSIKPKSNKSSNVPLLEVRKLTKKFGSLKANDQIDLKIKKGEIHALLGENGAGKSTLVKMLYGSLQPTSGEIVWNGELVNMLSPYQARAAGVGMVFQHFSLFESLTVADNIVLSLGPEYTVEQVAKDAEKLSADYGLPLNANSIIGDLSVGERQRVEIVRCLLQNPKLIILDEPTSVLTPQEADSLFVTLKRLSDEGRSILYISHRLDEVQKLCDKATILRNGKWISECNPKKETAASLATMMVGEDIAEIKRSGKKSNKQNDVLLHVNNANVEQENQFSVELKNINLEIKSGEIVGVAGVAGNGQNEFFSLLSGEATITQNAISIRGNEVGHLGINERRELGAAFVPEERLGHGAVPNAALSQNMILTRHQSDKVAFKKFGAIGYIWQEMVVKATKRVCEAMDVRKAGEDPVAGSLSGGNLQKYIMGRELDRQPSVLIVNQPTWGVDAGAAQRIRQTMIDLAKAGSAVLVISQDLDEILEMSDRIAVMHEGTLIDAGSADKITREQIGLLMGGMTNNASTDSKVKNKGAANAS